MLDVFYHKMYFITIVFLLAMNITIENIFDEVPKLIQSEPQHVKAFMIDLFLKSTTLNGAQEFLN